ncbi:MAG: hypothetical protein KAT05_00575 [Spirochaetes bacterium]|nr:hypothetical protein [Spirochaetota bacterium]
MKSFNKKIKKIILLIISLLFPLILAACYGAPVMEPYLDNDATTDAIGDPSTDL